jgi:CheY-like chemotaxis protein
VPRRSVIAASVMHQRNHLERLGADRLQRTNKRAAIVRNFSAAPVADERERPLVIVEQSVEALGGTCQVLVELSDDRFVLSAHSNSACKNGARNGICIAGSGSVNVLVVDDDASLCHLIAHEFERNGISVTSTDSSVDAILKLQQKRYAVMLLDIMLNGSSGLYVVDALRDSPVHDRPRVVVITGVHSNILSTIDRGVVKAVFFKPLDVHALANYVKSIAA